MIVQNQERSRKVLNIQILGNKALHPWSRKTKNYFEVFLGVVEGKKINATSHSTFSVEACLYLCKKDNYSSYREVFQRQFCTIKAMT